MYYEYTNEKYHTYHNEITSYTNHASYTVHIVGLYSIAWTHH